ncbi:uncharacterized protein STEHIDRAFT_110544 [Stereum hirsutum FP-91666 SS1]|uniref:uncharacterized protein n=1 Tax=Stereum hirsutum (strain FP-91666) TaxID=721885 RepID=UPI000440DA8E|nr:uncharacterized protein STEHIDRAFT_110544 [Stereum hirsutum FP-91666 SS1]EIM87297.1 hypothetical protein STEHIDRAFT_110544 [Stereum hirsutum FP-91666 SS1]
MSSIYDLSVLDGGGVALRSSINDSAMRELANGGLPFDVFLHILSFIPMRERTTLMWHLRASAPYFAIAFDVQPKLWMDVFSGQELDFERDAINRYVFGLWLSLAAINRRLRSTVTTTHEPRDLNYTLGLLPDEAWPHATRLDVAIPTDDRLTDDLGGLLDLASNALEITLAIDVLNELNVVEDDDRAASLYDILLTTPRLETVEVRASAGVLLSERFWSFPPPDPSSSILVPHLQHVVLAGDAQQTPSAYNYLVDPSIRPLTFVSFLLYCHSNVIGVPYPDLALVPPFREAVLFTCDTLFFVPNFFGIACSRIGPSGRRLAMEGHWEFIDIGFSGWTREDRRRAFESYLDGIQAIVFERRPPTVGLFDTNFCFGIRIMSYPPWDWLSTFVCDGDDIFLERILHYIYHRPDQMPLLENLRYRYNQGVYSDEVRLHLLSILRVITIPSFNEPSDRELKVHFEVSTHVSFEVEPYITMFTYVFCFLDPSLSRLV